MDITINTTRVGTGTGIAGTDAMRETTKAASPRAVNLTVSEAGGKDEVAVSAAAIPADALARDDALGKMVNSAFALPPPPMPDFR